MLQKAKVKLKEFGLSTLIIQAAKQLTKLKIIFSILSEIMAKQRITQHKRFANAHPNFCFAKTSDTRQPLGEMLAAIRERNI